MCYYQRISNFTLIVVIFLCLIYCTLSDAQKHSSSSSSSSDRDEDYNVNDKDNKNEESLLPSSSSSSQEQKFLISEATTTTTASKEGRHGRKRQHQNKQRAKHVSGVPIKRHGKSSSLLYNSTENTNPFLPITTFNPSSGGKQQQQQKNKSNTKVGDTRPNIILIITDDQDIELGSMEFMPHSLKVFRDEGIEFRHGYVTTPMCCPSRSSLLTGLYVHNHQVYTNNDNCSSVTWRSKYEKKTFNHYLHSSGYYTSYIGKYLNKYDGSHIPAGWNEWLGLLMNSRFYNYTVNRNGKKVRYGNNYETDYYPDVITRDTLDFLDRMSPVPNEPKPTETSPFLLVVSFPSPHGPEDAHPQYSEMFFNVTPHHTPNYNYAPNLDKQWLLRRTGKMTPQLKNFTNLLMTKRLQALQSVDAAIKSMFNKLEESGLVNSTYVFYTSDHGYHVGQFGLVKGKSMPYEFDIRVPFFLSTPKILFNKSATIQEPVLNIDLAPTFIDLAGLPVPSHMDGRSLVPLLKKYMDDNTNSSSSNSNSDDESQRGRSWNWSSTFIIESSGRREFPSSSLDGGSSKPKISNDSHNKKADRMQNICTLHPYPCLSHQKKYCRVDHNNQIRFRKCRHRYDYQNFHSTSGKMSNNSTTNNDEEKEINIRSRPLWNDKSSKCRCSGGGGGNRMNKSRNRRDVSFDWEEERSKIDGEIDELKLRINGLREKRRKMRLKWIQELKTRTTMNKQQQELPWTSDYETNSNRTITSEKGKRRRLHQHNNNNNNQNERGFPGFIECMGDENDCDKFTRESRIFHNTKKNRNQDGSSPSIVTATTTSSSSTTKNKINQKGLIRHSDEIDGEEYDDDDGDEAKEENEEEEENDEDGEISERDFHEADNDNVDEDEDEEEITHQEDVKSKKIKPFNEHRDTITTTIEQNVNRNRHHNRGRLHKGRGHHRDFKKGKSNRQRSGHKLLQSKDLVESELEQIEHDNHKKHCNCRGESEVENDAKLLRFIEREERKRRKLKSKIRKKERFLNKIENPEERLLAENCGKEDKMNCFWHDNDHWRTKPLWTFGSFCFCMNSNNNSYSCLRSINATHNYLYCHFVTGFKMYFDLHQDPYELHNLIGSLPVEEEEWMLKRLFALKTCHGRNCWSDVETENIAQVETDESTIWQQIFGRWKGNKKKKNHKGKKKTN